MKKPKLHFTPTKNWMNDPNGFIYYKGVYHLFYQHFPYATSWGTMHWGHKTSKDLVHWQDHGIALYPSKAYDRNGCFSGSAIEVDDKMYLYYTAIVYDTLNEENIHVSGNGLIASQAMMISEDGYTFNPDTKRVVIPTFKEGQIGDLANTRDPKVWKENDQYYMVVGSQYFNQELHKKMGEVLVYTSKDALNWTYQNRIIEPKLDSNMWECPDLFALDGRYALIMSPENTIKDGINYPSHALISWVDFNNQTCEGKLVSTPTFLDYGLDLYAPQTTIDKDGNRVVIAWLRMPQPSEDGSWNGVFIYPRIIKAKGDHFYFQIHPNVDKLFIKEVEQFTNQEPVKISCDLEEGSKLDIGGYKITLIDNQVVVDRKDVFVTKASLFNTDSQAGTTFKTPTLKDGKHVDIYVDDQVIEIYVNNGEYVLSNIVYGLQDHFEHENVNNLKIYQL